MNVLVFLIGLFLVLFLYADVFYTAFSLRGAGPFTGPLTRLSWRLLVNTATPGGKNRLLKGAGMLIMVQTLLQWVLLLWAAHLVLFLSDVESLVNSQTKIPTTFWEKFYVSGYAVSTMGNGDFIGSSTFWKTVLTIAAFNGLLLLTVAITYLLQVLSKVHSKRSFCRGVSSFAQSPDQFADKLKTATSLQDLHTFFVNWSSQLATMAESHLSYPMVHFYYSAERRLSLAVISGVMHEGLYRFLQNSPPPQGSDKVYLTNLLQSLADLLQTLKDDFIPEKGEKESGKAAKEAPLQPASDWQQQQALIKGFLHNEGRRWEDIEG